MKAIVQVYASNSECSVQEDVYPCLQELQLIKVFPGEIYANTNILENFFKILCFQQEVSQLSDENEDIFIKNMLKRYIHR